MLRALLPPVAETISKNLECMVDSFGAAASALKNPKYISLVRSAGWGDDMLDIAAKLYENVRRDHITTPFVSARKTWVAKRKQDAGYYLFGGHAPFACQHLVYSIISLDLNTLESFRVPSNLQNATWRPSPREAAQRGNKWSKTLEPGKPREVEPEDMTLDFVITAWREHGQEVADDEHRRSNAGPTAEPESNYSLSGDVFQCGNMPPVKHAPVGSCT